MNKKILVVSILAVFMLVAITFATAVSSTTAKPVEKKYSPLFGIRTRLAIGERLQNFKENIKTKYVGERLFYLPFQFSVDNNFPRNSLQEKASIFGPLCGFSWSAPTCLYHYTCVFPPGCVHPD